MKNNFNKAFTLIELLVVIAIIGLLSSIVLASLSSARDKAKTAKILSSLNSIHTQAEIYRLDNNTYEGLCQDTKISEMVSALDASSSGAACWVSTDTYADYRTELAETDYGVGVTANDIYYGADPTGTFTFDTSNTGLQNWTNAMTACTDGKRLPGPSILRAIYNIDGTPTGFTANYYWSYLESSSLTSSAYGTYLFNGTVSRYGKGTSMYVQCVN